MSTGAVLDAQASFVIVTPEAEAREQEASPGHE